MRRILLAVSMVTALAAGGAASAADIPGGPAPYYSSPAVNSVFSWAGPYVGVNLGYEWGSVSNSGADPSGIAGGLLGGYNWQYNNFVFGGEADVTFSGADDTFAPYKFSNPWFGTLRGRLGYAFSNVLVYGTGGFAFGDLTATSAGIDETHTLTGWTAGAGMEVGFTPNWSARVEYLYLDLSDQAYAITGTQNGLGASMLRFGVSYHF